MKKALGILLLALVAGVSSFFIMRWQTACHSATPILLDSVPELAWLRTELKLTDDQFAKATDLHKAYRPHCQEMCARIATARHKVEQLSSSTNKTPELDAALRNYATVQADCQQAMLTHFHDMARLFDTSQAEHYLKVMVPYALGASPCNCEKSHGP